MLVEYVDTDGDGILSANELIPLSADITSLGILVFFVTSVVTSAVLGWRLRSLAASHRLRERWQTAAQAELSRIEAEQVAAQGSVEKLSRGVLERTKSGEDAEREIRNLEGELQELTEEKTGTDATGDTDTNAVVDEAVSVAAAHAGTTPLRLKRSVSEKDRQRAVLLQDRLRKARAEKAALRDQAAHEREHKERAEVALQESRKRLAEANQQLAEAQKAAEEEEQARHTAAAKLEAEPAYQLLSRALPLPPSWKLFNWEPPSDFSCEKVG